ncbi:MAG: mycothiol conjugate amidase Mca [Kineosporiaceae bacterium]
MSAVTTPSPAAATADGGPLRLMAVHAHPDDEASKGAATVARYVSEGVEVLVVTCTGGERGDILNPRLRDDAAVLGDLAGVRRREMTEAARVLGVRHEWLGFVDSGLPEGDPPPPLPEGSFATLPLEVAAAPLVDLVRRFRPHVVTTYDENGGYPHPDHIMTHRVSVEAFEAAADPDRYPAPGGGPAPWQPIKLYYHATFSRAKVVAYHEALVAAGRESPFVEWLQRRDDWPERTVTTRVPCADWFDVADRALLAHATQVDPEGMWFVLGLAERQELWPTEDYELARSLVGDVRPAEPEDDLFAGIRRPAAVAR